MKSKVKLMCAAMFAVTFIAGCTEEKNKKIDDAVIKPAKGVEVSPAGKEAEEKAKAAAGSITNGEKPVFPKAPGMPQGQTIKELIASLNLPEVVATVGDEKITRQNLIKEIEAPIPEAMRKQALPPQITANISSSIGKIVDAMVGRKLILKLAAADGIKPSATLLMTQFDKQMKKVPPLQLEAFKKNLAAQGSSLKKHKAKLAKDLGAQDSVAIDKWIETKIVPSVKVDNAAAEKFYKDNQARFKKPSTIQVAHILIVPEKPSTEKLAKMTDEEKKKYAEEADKKAKVKIDEIMVKVKKGEDFAKLAKENSKCPSGVEDGGVLPAFDKTGAIEGAGPRSGRMDKVFTDASYKLKPGDISDVVKTRFGYHIIKGVKKLDESFIPYLEVKEKLVNNLQREQISKKLKAMVEAERKKCKVKIFVK